MQTLFTLCAVIGGSVLILQSLMLVFGMGADADVEMDGMEGTSVLDADPESLDSASDGFLKFLSVKTIVAFLTFFGLVGLAGQQAGWGRGWTLLAAVCAGSAAIYLVAGLMEGLAKLQHKGNVDLSNAVGHGGTVYLRVPERTSGVGRVTVAVQGRTIECRAVTQGPELPTGTPIVVRSLATSDTLEVAAMTSE